MDELVTMAAVVAWTTTGVVCVVVDDDVVIGGLLEGAKVEETEMAVIVDEGVSVKTKGTREVELVALEEPEELEELEGMLVVEGLLEDEDAAAETLELVVSDTDELEPAAELVVETAASGLLEVVDGAAEGAAEVLGADTLKPRTC